MAAARSLSTFIAAGTNTAAGATTTGSVVSVATAYGGTITCKILNGSTPPTVPPTVSMYGSSDNFATAGKLFYSFAGDAVASSSTEKSVDIPIGFQQLRVDVGGNTGAAVTSEAFAHIVTGI